MKPESLRSGQALYLWRVSLLGAVELGAYTREEAIYQALVALSKSGSELLRPFRIELLGVIEGGEPAEEDEKEESAPVGQAAKQAAAMLESDFGGGEFEPDAEIKAKWIRELSEKITREVTEKLSEGARPVPIPLKEEK